MSALYARLDSGHPSSARSDQKLDIVVDFTGFKDAAAGVIASFEDYVPTLELIGFSNLATPTIPEQEMRAAHMPDRATLAELANRIVSSAAMLKQANAELAA